MHKLMNCFRALSMTLALSMTVFLAGCGATSQQRAGAAARLGAEAGLVPRALERQEAELPADCRRWQTSGVQPGDRLDVALIKTDTALTQANLRVRRCAGWHDTTFGGP